MPLHTPVLLYKVGFKGVYITRTCFRDGVILKRGVCSTWQIRKIIPTSHLTFLNIPYVRIQFGEYLVSQNTMTKPHIYTEHKVNLK